MQGSIQNKNLTLETIYFLYYIIKNKELYVKKIIKINLFLLSFCYVIGATEIATVMGRPSSIVARDLITNEFDLADNKDVDYGTTWTYSIFNREKISSSTLVVVLEKNGSTSQAQWIEGLNLAAEHSSVVLSHIGPLNEVACTAMANNTKTAFVVVAGNDAREVNEQDLPECAAKNIIVVAALNQQTKNLMSYANWGTLVRLASPALEISVEDVLGNETKVSNTTVAASLAAARLAQFAKNNTTLTGAKLIDSFLEQETLTLPNLKDRVKDGRVIVE